MAMGHKHRMIEAWEPEFLFHRDYVNFKAKEIKRIHRRHNKHYRKLAKQAINKQLGEYNEDY